MRIISLSIPMIPMFQVKPMSMKSLHPTRQLKRVSLKVTKKKSLLRKYFNWLKKTSAVKYAVNMPWMLWSAKIKNAISFFARPVSTALKAHYLISVPFAALSHSTTKQAPLPRSSIKWSCCAPSANKNMFYSMKTGITKLFVLIFKVSNVVIVMNYSRKVRLWSIQKRPIRNK